MQSKIKRSLLRAALTGAVVVSVVIGDAAPASAQETPTDSVAARIRELQRRLDSLEAVIRRLNQGGQRAGAAEMDLAALRAAAAGAAREAAADAPDQNQQSRTRNLSGLNPEISVTGDLVGNFVSPDGASSKFSAAPREFELSFQAALDPYTHTKVFLSREEPFEIAGLPEEEEEGAGSFEIEEGYMYWVGLPGGLGFKVGKFRQEIGLYNRWHTHALFEVERPLAVNTFLGEDGLIQTGAGVTLPTFRIGPATQTINLEVTRGNNEALFEGGNDFVYLGRFQNFWDISPSTYFQLGATGLTGRNRDAGVESKILGLDASFRWTPGGQAGYRDLQLKAEWYFGERNTDVASLTGNGGYFQANYRVNQRWILGTRVDVVNPYGTDPDLFEFVPSITWWQSEWVRVRLQYNYLSPGGGSANHTALLQFVWAMGPHKHETY